METSTDIFQGHCLRTVAIAAAQDDIKGLIRLVGNGIEEQILGNRPQQEKEQLKVNKICRFNAKTDVINVNRP